MQMGCSSSKVDDEPIVLMCKERKRLIKQAVENRYAFAMAHEDYFRSLGQMGNALRRFAEGEAVLLSSSSSTSGDAQSPETSSAPKKSSDPATVAPEKSSSTSSLHLHSDSHSHHSPTPSESPVSPFHHVDDEQFFENGFRVPYGSPQMNYMRSGATPSRTVEERHNSPSRVTWGSYSGPSPYVLDSFFGTSMGAPSTSSPPPGPSYSPSRPPPPPSPPHNSAWDFFNPFVPVDSGYPYYNRGRLSATSEGSSWSSGRVREEEGIPDLEDDDQNDYPKKKLQEENDTTEKGKASAVEPLSSKAERGSNHDVSLEEMGPVKPSEEGDEPQEEKITNSSKADNNIPDSTPASEENSVRHFDVPRRRNILEIIKDIEIQFQRAQDAGKIVSSMLETNVVPYKPRFPFLRVISARLFAAFIWNGSKASEPTFSTDHQPSTSKNKTDDLADLLEENCGLASGSHSSTLDKIYVWEKKLCKEIKSSERMRIEYEKVHVQMTHHSGKWDNTNRIEAKRSKMRNLQTRMKVALQVVNSISQRIHRLRDEELQPQIIELIEGFTRMCREMLDCHQLQSRIISQTKFSGHLAAHGMLNESYQMATIQLERELQNWHLSFENWFRSQKAYVQSLNGWLLKCILYEPETTADGVIPFSPRRVGAPPVFIICNDWCQALETLPTDLVMQSIGEFEEQLKQACRKQDEEQLKRTKAETLSKNLEMRVLTMNKMEHSFHDPNIVSGKKIDLDTGQIGNSLSEEKISLDSFKKFVEQEHAEHRKIMEETHDLTLSNFYSGLKKAFVSLSSFTEASLKMYEDITKHSGKENISLENGEIGYNNDDH